MLTGVIRKDDECNKKKAIQGCFHLEGCDWDGAAKLCVPEHKAQASSASARSENDKAQAVELGLIREEDKKGWLHALAEGAGAAVGAVGSAAGELVGFLGGRAALQKLANLGIRVSVNDVYVRAADC